MSERILLVEADPDLLKILEAGLTFSEYDVTTAADGLEGFITAARQSFDLIITGQKLPAMDSDEFIKELAKIIVLPPVILLTGSNSPRQAVSDTPVKVTYLKPNSLYNLLEVVKSSLSPQLITN